MNLTDARKAVGEMYAAHGSTRPPEVIAQLAAEMVRTSCHLCALRVVGYARDEGQKPLTVPAFRLAYRNEYASPDHGLHVGMDDATARAAGEERFWHHEAVAHLGGGLRAEFTAARMWASEGVAASLEDVDASREIFMATGPAPDRELVDTAWAYARAIARTPATRMSETEWRTVREPFDREWSRCSAV